MGHINYLNESNTCQNPNYRIGTKNSSETGCQNFVVANVPPDSCSQSEMLLELSPNGAGRVTNEAVFFKAALSQNTGGITGAGGTAYFVADNVLQQIGDAYDAATGIFTAPYKGIYSFTCDLLFGSVGGSMTNGYGGINAGPNAAELVNYNSKMGLVRDPINRVSFHMAEILMMDVNATARCFAIIFSGSSNSVPILGMSNGINSPYSRFTGHMIQRLA